MDQTSVGKKTAADETLAKISLLQVKPVSPIRCGGVMNNVIFDCARKVKDQLF